MSREIYATVYTREGKQELTVSEWSQFDYFTLHREGDQPSVETAIGSKYWYKYGKDHRETGPAVIWFDGDIDYYLGGDKYSGKDFYKKLKEVDELPLSLALTHEEEWVRERAKNRNYKE